MIPRSTASPSIWWNTGEWRASSVSLRYVRPGHHRVDRRLLGLHHPDLHRRRVRAQQHLLRLAEVHVQRVLHRPRRVAGREVQRLEVVPVVLDLGPSATRYPRLDEHVLELAPALGDEVEVAPAATVAAQREVERRPRPRPRGASSARCGLDRLGDRRRELRDRLADDRLLVAREVLDRLLDPGRHRALAGQPPLELVELVDRPGRGDGRARPVEVELGERVSRHGRRAAWAPESREGAPAAPAHCPASRRRLTPAAAGPPRTPGRCRPSRR